MPYRRPSLEAFGREESEILAQRAREAFEDAVHRVTNRIHERFCPSSRIRMRLLDAYADLTPAQVEAFIERNSGESAYDS